MDHPNHFGSDAGSTTLTLLTTVLYILAVSTLTQWATIMAILAAGSTLAYNTVRIMAVRRKRKEDKQRGHKHRQKDDDE